MTSMWIAAALLSAAILLATARGGEHRARVIALRPARGSSARRPGPIRRVADALAHHVGIGPASRRRRARERMRVVQALGASGGTAGRAAALAALDAAWNPCGLERSRPLGR
jgi:hypothetical protein